MTRLVFGVLAAHLCVPALTLAQQTTPTAPATQAAVRPPRVERWDYLPIDTNGDRWLPLSFDSHVHSSHSRDAEQPTRTVLRWAERVGLGALILTDHGTVSGQHEFSSYRGPVLPMIGAEVGGAHGHALIWPMPDLSGVAEATRSSLNELGALVRSRGGLTVLAHPGWFIPGNVHDPMLWMAPEAFCPGGRSEQVDAIEAWNGTYVVPTTRVIDKWLDNIDQGVFVPIVTGSDFHRWPGQHLGRPRTVAMCRALEAQCLPDAVRNGRMYLTVGPSVSFVVDHALPGSVVVKRPGESIHVSVSATAPQGGTLELYLGRERLFELPLSPRQIAVTTWRIPAPELDSHLRVHVRRPRRVRGWPSYALITNPVRIDVTPTSWGARFNRHADLPTEAQSCAGSEGQLPE